MSVTLAQVLAGQGHLVVAFDDLKLECDFNPNAWTGALETEMDKIVAREGSDGPAIRFFLEKVLLGWDLTEEEGGPPLAITAENLARLPTRLQGQLWRDITAEMRPGEASGSSGAG